MTNFKHLFILFFTFYSNSISGLTLQELFKKNSSCSDYLASVEKANLNNSNILQNNMLEVDEECSPYIRFKLTNDGVWFHFEFNIDNEFPQTIEQPFWVKLIYATTAQSEELFSSQSSEISIFLDLNKYLIHNQIFAVEVERDKKPLKHLDGMLCIISKEKEVLNCLKIYETTLYKTTSNLAPRPDAYFSDVTLKVLSSFFNQNYSERFKEDALLA